jgi:hypothetical protein
VSLEDHFQAFSGADHWPPWNTAQAERSWYSVNDVCDAVCVEAFPYQVLSPGHLARLGGTPAGARPLAAGRVELALGDPYAWLPGSPLRAGAVASAREVLAPCLGDAKAILLERLRQREGT